jgi:hypothetical protein
MDQSLLALLIALFGGIPLVVIVLAFIAWNPEKVEKWGSILLRLLSLFPRLFKGARKKYVQYDLQGRINSFTKGLVKAAPFLKRNRVRIQWIDETVSKQAFLDDGHVILRLRREDPDDRNFVFGAYHYVSTSLLSKTRRYISPSHREAIDLFVTTKLLEKEKPSVMEAFLDEYLHPKTADPKGKVNRFFDSFTKMDKGDLFYPVFLQELHFLGNKVFGRRQDDKIIREVNGLIVHLDQLAERKIGEDVPGRLDFCRDYCRFGVIIVGRQYNVTPEGDVWVRYIDKHVAPKLIESLYILGPSENRSVIEHVCTSIGKRYEVVRAKSSKVRLTRQDGTRFHADRYLVVLRLRGAEVFQESE